MIKPVLHRILIRPEKVEEIDDVVRRAKAAGLAVQLDKREEKAVEVGTVVRVGSTAFKEFGSSSEDEGIKPGAKVIFAKYAQKEVKDNGEILFLMNDEDIVGVYEDD